MKSNEGVGNPKEILRKWLISQIRGFSKEDEKHSESNVPIITKKQKKTQCAHNIWYKGECNQVNARGKRYKGCQVRRCLKFKERTT